jgi:hypothetical protein
MAEIDLPTVETAEECLWSATRRNCVDWCREHVADWSNFVVNVIDAVSDVNSPTIIVLPSGLKFGRGTIAGNQGDFIVPKEIEAAQYHRHSIVAMEVIIIAVGIKSHVKPPQEIIDDWELKYETTYDIASVAATSMCVERSTKGIYMAARDDSSNPSPPNESLYKYSAQELSDMFVSFIKDPTIHVPRLLFTFKISLGRWEAYDSERLCKFLDSKIHPITGNALYESVSSHKGRDYVLYSSDNDSINTEEPYSGVAHLLLKVKDTMAEWRSVVNCVIHIPKVTTGTPVTLDVSFSW